MAKRPPPILLPRRELQAGVERCLAKAKRLNTDAELLLSAGGSVIHASVLFSYAVEELGKALLLVDAASRGTEDLVKIIGFYHHPTKLKRAEELVGEHALELRPGWVQRNFVSRGFVDVGTYASEVADRLEALYVDWQPLGVGGRWRPEPGVNADCLRRAIQKLGQVLESLQ
jgi:AbiV family abortive infection protein